MKGELAAITQTELPIIMQGPQTQVGLIRNDMCFMKELSKAAKTSDPIERMKHIITFFIA